MNEARSEYMSMTEVSQRQRTHPLRLAEVPVEHAISLPLPTRRWGAPAYACFAAPAVRRPENPPQQSPPDRWWAMGAKNGRLLAYALCQAVPFADSSGWCTVTLPEVGLSLAELRQALADLEAQVTRLAPVFFNGERGDLAARKALSESLERCLPAPLLPQYRALVPDFFAWLEA
jgi:hypothetical protein